ncbi:activator of basal transcription 1 [Stegostoma tigrinum]|uniref:activator of basal transcription 1 n=1 Tax=Stegostoma tigrinum TaxID=3053191 RepID=UPI00202B9F86|nr:activator of basal transcription 1 [Stegostoma tigrinum]
MADVGPVPSPNPDPDPTAGFRGPLPGVLYVGFLPPGLGPKQLRNMMSVFGEVGRVFIQERDQWRTWRKKKSRNRWKGQAEGWVEFQNKAIAKRVARSLHNTPIGTRKRSRFRDVLWNIKYLHRFKWIHLSERLAYEKLVRRQRMQAEVSQAKRETNFFLQNVEKSKGLDKLQEMKRRNGQEWQEKSWHFKQRETEIEIQASKAASRKRKAHELGKTAEIHDKSQSNVALLAKIFNPSAEQD